MLPNKKLAMIKAKVSCQFQWLQSKKEYDAKHNALHVQGKGIMSISMVTELANIMLAMIRAKV